MSFEIFTSLSLRKHHSFNHFNVPFHKPSFCITYNCIGPLINGNPNEHTILVKFPDFNKTEFL